MTLFSTIEANYVSLLLQLSILEYKSFCEAWSPFPFPSHFLNHLHNFRRFKYLLGLYAKYKCYLSAKLYLFINFSIIFPLNNFDLAITTMHKSYNDITSQSTLDGNIRKIKFQKAHI